MRACVVSPCPRWEFVDDGRCLASTDAATADLSKTQRAAERASLVSSSHTPDDANVNVRWATAVAVILLLRDACRVLCRLRPARAIESAS